MFQSEREVDLQIGLRVLKAIYCFLYPALDGFVRSPIFADDTIQVYKLVNFFDVVFMQLHWVLLLVVYPHDLGLPDVDLGSSLLGFSCHTRQLLSRIMLPVEEKGDVVCKAEVL